MAFKGAYLLTGKDWLIVSPSGLLTGYCSKRSVILIPPYDIKLFTLSNKDNLQAAEADDFNFIK